MTATELNISNGSKNTHGVGITAIETKEIKVFDDAGEIAVAESDCSSRSISEMVEMAQSLSSALELGCPTWTSDEDALSPRNNAIKSENTHDNHFKDDSVGGEVGKDDKTETQNGNKNSTTNTANDVTKDTEAVTLEEPKEAGHISPVTRSEEAGVCRHTFSRDDMLRIQSQWIEDDSDDDMKGRDKYWLPINPYQRPDERLKMYEYDSEYEDEDEMYLDSDLMYVDRSQEPGYTRRILDYTFSTAKTIWKNGLRPAPLPKENEKLVEEVERQRALLRKSLHDTASSLRNSIATTLSSASDSDEGIVTTNATPSGDGISVSIALPPPEEDFITSITIIPEKRTSSISSCPHILSESAMLKIANDGLPQSLSMSKWKRLYNLARDGDSFNTFLQLVKSEKRTLLVVKTTRGDIFGGYADSPWETQHLHEVGHAFYGGGQAFLFKMLPALDKSTENNESVVKIFKWTGINRYTQYIDPTHKMLCMGGGGEDGSFGLCVEDDFRIGSTGRCDTFHNELLADSAQFNILDVEVWGFTSCGKF